jgi:hypothetical protein
LADLTTHKGTSEVPIGLLGEAGQRACGLAFDACIADPPAKDTLARVIRGRPEGGLCRVLLLEEAPWETDYLRAMLAELPGVYLTACASAEEAAHLVGALQVDVVVVRLLDPHGGSLQLAEQLQNNPVDRRPRLAAVIPREPSPANCLALRNAFQSHLADCGLSAEETTARVLQCLLGPTDAAQSTVPAYFI